MYDLKRGRTAQTRHESSLREDAVQVRSGFGQGSRGLDQQAMRRLLHIALIALVTLARPALAVNACTNPGRDGPAVVRAEDPRRRQRRGYPAPSRHLRERIQAGSVILLERADHCS